jgi:hypothetical protein
MPLATPSGPHTTGVHGLGNGRVASCAGCPDLRDNRQHIGGEAIGYPLGSCVRLRGGLGQISPVAQWTVRRALAALKAVGLVMWQCRLVRAGWRAAQTSNAYVLALAGVGTLAAKPALRTGGQSVRETLQESFLLPASAVAIADARAALARRRAVVEAMLTK